MTFDELRAVDKSDMYTLVREFPAQVREAIALGEQARIRLKASGIQNIVLTGLGGSAISGDLLRCYLGDELKVPFIVNRHYVLPAFVGPKTLVIVSSYSGNTEETLSAFKEALRRKATILCISSGGAVANMARRRKLDLITVPGGRPPRTALAYSFFPLLIALSRARFIAARPKHIAETLALLEVLCTTYGNPAEKGNRALQLAQQLRGHIGVIYSASDHFEAVNTRWRGEIAENAKSLAFGNVLPEMNHNELVGWKVLLQQMQEMEVFLLRDRDDHTRVQMRMDITKGIIAGYSPHATEVWSEGRSLLARMFSLICLGDWVSYYLAILHGEDPTPVTVIDHLKTELAKI